MGRRWLLDSRRDSHRSVDPKKIDDQWKGNENRLLSLLSSSSLWGSLLFFFPMAHLFFICFLFIRLISFSWVFWKLNKKKTNKRKTNERAIGKRAPTTKKKIMEVRYSWSLRATLDQSVQPKVDPEDTLTVALTDQPHFQYLFCVGFPFLNLICIILKVDP